MRNVEFYGNNSNKLPEQMGARNQEVSPVGAWAQPATDFTLDAVEMASQEEQRLLKLQSQKAADLKKFQDEVKFRVQTMNKLKRQQWLDKSSKAVLNEQDLISQSSTAVDKPSTGRRNCCILRSVPDLSIQKGLKSSNETIASKHFQEQMKQVDQLHCHARSCLATNWEDFGQHSTLKNFPKDTCSDLMPLSEKNTGFDTKDAMVNVSHGIRNILPDAENAKVKQWSEQQRATCRRFFMDVERERVKRNIHQKEHLEKMKLLKRKKEVERLDLEQLAVVFTESVESSRSLEDTEPIAVSEMESQHCNVRKLDKWKEKMKQVDRYLSVVKRSLKDKMEKQNIEPVQICLCGSSLWDTSPLTCANNCVFYQNPVGFAKALQSLLSSFLAS